MSLASRLRGKSRPNEDRIKSEVSWSNAINQKLGLSGTSSNPNLFESLIESN